ncbi:hypothetical protein QLX08_010958 [Tetragonisca angustula]|uniref:Uncharacterized protein n=1 Tax=Tetragonisca angustula TaxID=166442 RepID=A0AAW0ZAB7_9HYME
MARGIGAASTFPKIIARADSERSDPANNESQSERAPPSPALPSILNPYLPGGFASFPGGYLPLSPPLLPLKTFDHNEPRDACQRSFPPDETLTSPLTKQ